MAQFGPEFPDSSTKKWLSLVRNQWLSLVRNYWLNLVRNNQYIASLDLLFEAIKLVRRAFIFDNSERKYKLVAEFFKGEMKYHDKKFPAWFLKNVIEKQEE